MRARAFHILDPKGIVEMFLIFIEERGGAELIPPSFDNSEVNIFRLIVWDTFPLQSSFCLDNPY